MNRKNNTKMRKPNKVLYLFILYNCTFLHEIKYHKITCVWLNRNGDFENNINLKISLRSSPNKVQITLNLITHRNQNKVWYLKGTIYHYLLVTF